MRVIFAGGGTGGHLYPAIAIAEVLKKKGIDFKFLVSDRGIEARILTTLGYEYVEQKVSAFKGKGLFYKIKAVFKLLLAVIKTFSLINKNDKVFLTGGFASAPAAIVAKIKGCQLYLHEQNSVMGLVNRFFAKFSNKVFLSFPETKKATGNIVVTGNPIRKKFKRKNKEEEFKGRILVLGGSQGSKKINELIIDSIEEIINLGFTVFHQTGEGLYNQTLNSYGSLARKYEDKIIIKPYIEDMANKMKDSDIVIARSGAGTVFETIAVGCPAIYIPLKIASDNHQYFNALFANKQGYALILMEDEANKDELIKKILEIKENIDIFKEKIFNTSYINSVDIIVREAGID